MRIASFKKEQLSLFLVDALYFWVSDYRLSFTLNILFFSFLRIDLVGGFNVKLLEVSSSIILQIEEIERQQEKQQRYIQLLD